MKSTVYKRRGEGYSLNVMGPQRERYPSGVVDFFAVYLIPIDTWYIIPYALMGRTNCSLHFHAEVASGISMRLTGRLGICCGARRRGQIARRAEHGFAVLRCLNVFWALIAALKRGATPNRGGGGRGGIGSRWFSTGLFGKWNRNHFVVASARRWCMKIAPHNAGPCMRLSPIQCSKGPAPDFLPLCFLILLSGLAIMTLGVGVIIGLSEEPLCEFLASWFCCLLWFRFVGLATRGRVHLHKRR